MTCFLLVSNVRRPPKDPCHRKTAFSENPSNKIYRVTTKGTNSSMASFGDLSRFSNNHSATAPSSYNPLPRSVVTKGTTVTRTCRSINAELTCPICLGLLHAPVVIRSWYAPPPCQNLPSCVWAHLPSSNATLLPVCTGSAANA